MEGVKFYRIFAQLLIRQQKNGASNECLYMLYITSLEKTPSLSHAEVETKWV